MKYSYSHQNSLQVLVTIGGSRNLHRSVAGPGVKRIRQIRNRDRHIIFLA